MNALWGLHGLRLSAVMLAADPKVDDDPLGLLHELLEAYNNEDLVFDLWIIAQAMKEGLGW